MPEALPDIFLLDDVWSLSELLFQVYTSEVQAQSS